MSSSGSDRKTLRTGSTEQAGIPGGERDGLSALTLDSKRGRQVQSIEPTQAVSFGQVPSAAEERFGDINNANGGPTPFKLSQRGSIRCSVQSR